jgi:spermidine synthase
MARTEETIYSGSSRFAHYDIVDMEYDNRPARVLFSGNKIAAQSGVALDDRPDLLFDYNQRFIEVIESLKPKKILLIGGGVLTLPMALIAAYPKIQIDVVELDPVLPTLAERYFDYTENDRIHVICQEGWRFLKSCASKYDLILIDAFSHTAMPRSLTTLKAITRAEECLSLNGAIAVNIISAYYGRNADIIRQQHERYNKVFKKVEIFPANRSLLSYWIPQNFVLVAQKGRVRELTLRFDGLESPPDYQ